MASICDDVPTLRIPSQQTRTFLGWLNPGQSISSWKPGDVVKPWGACPWCMWDKLRKCRRKHCLRAQNWNSGSTTTVHPKGSKKIDNRIAFHGKWTVLSGASIPPLKPTSKVFKSGAKLNYNLLRFTRVFVCPFSLVRHLQ